MPQFNEEQQKRRLEELRNKEAEDLARLLAEKYDLPYADLFQMTIDLDALQTISENEARSAHAAAFQRVGKTLDIALTNPSLPATKALLESLKEHYSAELFLVSERSLSRAWERYKEVPEFKEAQRGVIDISADRLAEFGNEIRTTEELERVVAPLIASGETRRISTVMEAILAGALALEASDIHIEPQEADARLRLRLDGVLQEMLSLPKPVFQLVLSRIKLISELKLNIRDEAQDGRFTVRAAKTDIEVRTSILPGPYGESVVLRILHPKTIALTLEDLGLNEQVLQIINEQAARPNGMILTTGPTGSGKTTTLYALLKLKRTPGIKIITIENPIEYHLEGITQTQVDRARHYDFAGGLRAILRQDPDVIMVGEIRDLETAQTALHAALTGHIVFSTLHTNNAAGTIPRLIDLGVKPNIIAPALNVAMAQRLVRRLCPECKKGRPATRGEITSIEKLFTTLSSSVIRPRKPYQLWDAGTCQTCNGTGYKGRVGIAEAFIINDEIERLIITQPTESDIRDSTVRQGMVTMEQDGVFKALVGITSVEELVRVLGVKLSVLSK